MPRLAPFFFCCAVLLGGCTSEPPSEEAAPASPELALRPPLLTAADSLAWRITEAAGGLDAWHALSTLRYDFAVVRDTIERFRARHLWDRTTGHYRVEYPVGKDSMLVARFDLGHFNPAVPTGGVYLNGTPLDSNATRERLVDAYERFVNDSYWLLAPLKLFDPGVRRAIAPDSADAETEVLLLSFENVGMTPGDRYWLRADSTGRLVSWSFALEGGGRGHYRWTDVAELATPVGPLRLATRKRADGRAILTEVFPADSLATGVFDDPNPRL